MDEEKRSACEQIVTSLKSLYSAKTISESQYYKGIVSVAYEYANAEEIGECLNLLGIIPLEYVTYGMQQELENDALFADILFRLSKILEQSGAVRLESEVTPNMSPAKA